MPTRRNIDTHHAVLHFPPAARAAAAGRREQPRRRTGTRSERLNGDDHKWPTRTPRQHDYHLVDPSPWPTVGSIAAFLVAVGAIFWMHKMFCRGAGVFAVGVVGILYTMIAWWRDVIHEAERDGYHTRVVQLSHRYGMILFIASEVMFFVAWFWAYFNTALFPADAHQIARTELLGGVWPPKGIETFDPWHLPLLNTLILLTSGTTVTWAHHALLTTTAKA